MTTETPTLTFHIDPGHGWLEVDWTYLKRLGLNPTDFSRYSYRRRNTFFLEEDCDAPKFLAAFAAQHGSEPDIREVHCEDTGFNPRRCASIW